MFKKNDTKYRQEGLSMMQASRLDETRAAGSSKVLIAGLAVVAVGCLAYIGVQKVTTTTETRVIYSAAPPEGTARQLMMALKVPHDREKEAARLALLNDETGPMEIRSLTAVEELTDPNARLRASTAQVISDQNATPTPTSDLAEVETASAAPDDEAAEIEPQVEVAATQTETEAPIGQIDEIETLRAAVDPQLLNDTVLVSACFDELQTVARNSTIFFGVGSSQLTGQDLAILSRIGQLAANCKSAKIQVTGHSDTSGNDLTNLQLSWQRADNTVSAMSQLGIDTSRIEPVGFGARAPLSQGDASDDELNRRVEFVILKDTGGN